MPSYYNEWDKETAAWLRELIREKLIPEGVVDERSIREVEPRDLEGYDQCHFFAGIGGWPLALKIAGVPDDFPLWTGSCPCQSFSSMGEQRGFADERDLWPAKNRGFYRLIAKRRPPLLFGEQVEAAVRVGDESQSWLDRLARDLGKAGYEVGSAVLSARYVGADHLRERIYFVADSSGQSAVPALQPIGTGARGEDLVALVGDGRVFDLRRFWDDREWLLCDDGKKRGRESGAQPVDDGLPEDVALLRGAGNAIVPQLAAEFIAAYFEAKGQMRRRPKPRAKAAGAGR
ncbi:MAG: DNA cytosine methyltransferase [Candidatus Sulfotelmatobacter sp.]